MPSHTLVNRAGHSLKKICPFNMVPNEARGVGRTFPRALPLNCFKENPGSKQKLAVSIQPFISLNKQAASRLSPPWESSPRQQADLGKREKSALPPFSGSMGHMCTMQIQPHANQTLAHWPRAKVLQVAVEQVGAEVLASHPWLPAPVVAMWAQST